jgi:Flp pilus assembly protein TadG
MLHRNRRDSSEGQSLVEFALVVPIFVLLLVGLFDIGRAVWNYNTVANSAREAARVAVVNQDEAAIRGAAKTAGISLSLDDADITLDACADQECLYSVTVSYDYEPVTPLISSLFNLTLTSTAVMPLEYENPGP